MDVESVPNHRSSLEDLELALELELNGALEPIRSAGVVEVGLGRRTTVEADRERTTVGALLLLQGTTMQEASCCPCRATSSHLCGTRARGQHGTLVLAGEGARLQREAEVVAERVWAQRPTPSQIDEYQEVVAAAAEAEKQQARRWPSPTS